MAKEVEAKVKVTVDKSAAEKAFDGLKKGADALGKGLKSAAAVAGKAFNGIKNAAGSVAKGIGGIFSSIGKLGIITAIGGAITGAFKGNQAVVDAFNKVITAVSLIFNQIASAIIKVVGEQNKLNGGFDATKKVIGGLITGALNILLGAIQSIQLVVFSVQKAWEESIFGSGDEGRIKELTANINETKEALKETGEALVESGKQVVNNFGEAVKEVGNTAQAVLKAVVEEAKNIDVEKALTDAERLVQLRKQAALADAERQRIQLEFQTTAEQLRQLRDDETRSIEDRQESNNKLLETLEEQARLEEQQIKIKIAAAAAEFNLQQTNENLVALKSAQLELTDLQERLEGQRSEALSNQNALLKEQVAIARANTEANLALLEQQLTANADLESDETKRLQMQLQNIEILKQARLLAIEDELAQTAEGTARYAELVNQRKQIEQDAAIETAQTQRELDEKRLADRKAFEAASFNLAKTSLSAIGDLATLLAGDDEKKRKKAFELNKKLQIGTATIDTFSAIVAALGDKTVPGPVRIAQAAAIGIAGFVNVAKIKATKFESSGASGGGSATPVNTRPSLAPQANQAVAAPTVTNRESPIRAYVVADEVTNQQQANKRVSDAARL